MQYKVILPWYITLSLKTIFYINLNNYRNAHYQTLSKAKKLFGEEVFQQIFTLPKMKKVKLVYTIFPQRKCDISNVCSIADKFFCDELVKNKKLVDDDFKHVVEVVYKFGEADKENPRIEVEIIEA